MGYQIARPRAFVLVIYPEAAATECDAVSGQAAGPAGSMPRSSTAGNSLELGLLRADVEEQSFSPPALADAAVDQAALHDGRSSIEERGVSAAFGLPPSPAT